MSPLPKKSNKFRQDFEQSKERNAQENPKSPANRSKFVAKSSLDISHVFDCSSRIEIKAAMEHLLVLIAASTLTERLKYLTTAMFSSLFLKLVFALGSHICVNISLKKQRFSEMTLCV